MGNTTGKRSLRQESYYDYDLVVIGGGSGGLAAAKQAADLGAKVCVFDYVTPTPIGTKWGLGGTCLNVGCIPKKLMHHAALLGEAIEDAVIYGWKVPKKLKHDWSSMCESIQNHIKSENWLIKVSLKDKNIQYINAFGTFKDAHTVTGTTKTAERIVTGKYILIAVGGRPKYPEIPGAIEYGITSDDIFSLEKPPGKTLIVGAGYVGLECAGFLNGLGYDVTVMIRSTLLRGFDRQMVKIIEELMVNKGIQFLHNCTTKSVKKLLDGKLQVKWSNDKHKNFTSTFDTVLFAIGREISMKRLKLDNAGVKSVDNRIDATNEQTNVPNIYAVGDILLNKPQLTPVAINAGKLLALRLFSDLAIEMNYENVATTIYTPLEYGCVGLSEEAAIEKYGGSKIEVYHAYYMPLEFTVREKDVQPSDYCYLKVITSLQGDKKVLGMHIIGPDAGEIIQGYSAAINCGLTIEKLMTTVGIHPTVSEEFTRVNITKRSGIDPKPGSCCS